VVHQPPPNSFGAAVRTKNTHYGYYGSYIVRAKAVTRTPSDRRRQSAERELREKVGAIIRQSLELRGGALAVGTLLHSVYQGLSGEEVLTLARHSARQFLRECISGFAEISGDQVHSTDPRTPSAQTSQAEKSLREALLDAKALYANSRDKTNQVYQQALQRFHQGGISFDDIRSVAKSIPDVEVCRHRRDRLLGSVGYLGELLG